MQDLNAVKYSQNIPVRNIRASYVNPALFLSLSYSASLHSRMSWASTNKQDRQKLNIMLNCGDVDWCSLHYITACMHDMIQVSPLPFMVVAHLLQ